MSFQYNFAKSVIKLHCMPSRTATLRDLGWHSGHLDVIKVPYFIYLLQMDNPLITFKKLCLVNFPNCTKTMCPYIFNILVTWSVYLKQGSWIIICLHTWIISHVMLRVCICHTPGYFYKGSGQLGTSTNIHAGQGWHSHSDYLMRVWFNVRAAQLKFNL